jgi:integrase/recombinase XerD
MNLQEALQDYLTLRRGLGFKLISDGKALASFVCFLERNHQDTITTELALAWAKLPTRAQPAQWAKRLGIVRSFARYCRVMDQTSEVPPCELLQLSYQRPNPYLFSDGDIQQLLQAALQYSEKNHFFMKTLHCLFGLLSVTGLRINEALGLTLDDVDLDSGVLTIRHAKFGKTRLIPLHSTTLSALIAYREERERELAGYESPPYWFVDKQKGRLSGDCVRYRFNLLIKSIGLHHQTRSHRPHLQDLRHYFARSVLIMWYRNDQDVERCLPTLSAYLGHVETRDTYWYLSACPALMSEAAGRLERQWGTTR